MNSASEKLPGDILEKLLCHQPFLWLNQRLGQPLPPGVPPVSAIAEAEARLSRCAGLMSALFPEIRSAQGRIESPLLEASRLQRANGSAAERDGTWFIKADHALPIAGSIKARGSFHEILALAESIALEHGILGQDTPRDMLASDAARELFRRHTVTVGSTGNLGFGIGVLASALGFETVVHMSSDAAQWKKDRLRNRGVQVVEHAGDYAEAVAAGRAQSEGDALNYFVDDERSLMLFLGYAAAARHLAEQLSGAGRTVDAQHPLFVYVPCGVGGAPGGITFGLKALFGSNVHCFFAEPVASPCMLVQLASMSESPLSVYDVGLDNRTAADGLAVGQASYLVSPIMAAQLSGVFTVTDSQLYAQLLRAAETQGVELEPSAAAGILGPQWLTDTEAGRQYIRAHGLVAGMSDATHVIWTTGGSMVPPEEHRRYQALAKALPSQS